MFCIALFRSGYMKTIRSKDNQIYKSTLKLLKKKYRDETGRYLLEGVKPLEDAVGTGAGISSIVVREGIFPDTDKYAAGTVILSGELFDKLSSTENSQGIIAVAEKRIYSEADFGKAVGKGNILVMDRLQDPGNIGTMIRTAEAAGYKGIILTSGTGDVYSPKVVRAAAGSLFRMPVLNAGDSGEAVELIRRMGKKITVTCPDNGINCFEADMVSDTALVIGNEGRGVSRGFMENADIKVKIPMAGSIESLNAAVAAGILMYQSQR